MAEAFAREASYISPHISPYLPISPHISLYLPFEEAARHEAKITLALTLTLTLPLTSTLPLSLPGEQHALLWPCLLAALRTECCYNVPHHPNANANPNPDPNPNPKSSPNLT